jgi:[CysO sulfur-carrier protein]-S-L-cysteine hydrolase
VPEPLASPALRMTHAQYDTVLAHCFDGFPDEACGLLAGPFAAGAPTGEVIDAYPCRDAEGKGNDIVGVWHSHTHTDAYPSATDVRQAVDPAWCYVIVSLKSGEPVMRGYYIRDGVIAECPVEVG